MKAGPLSCPECGAQVWGVPENMEFAPFFHRKDGMPVLSVQMDAECSDKHRLNVHLFPDRAAEVVVRPVRKAVKP